MSIRRRAAAVAGVAASLPAPGQNLTNPGTPPGAVARPGHARAGAARRAPGAAHAQGARLHGWTGASAVQRDAGRPRIGSTACPRCWLRRQTPADAHLGVLI